MEKISLKPVAREINYKATEPHTYLDAFEYGPQDDKEKRLGHLYVVGQVKYGEEDMAYVLNLVSSLAKREYYTGSGTIAEDPKKALDSALKKLNGVLEDFFKNKDLKLNIGLVAIAGENIFIAKLGKFKVFLARQGEMIDILNNINLFQKEHVQEKQFVNIISGKIFDGDKIFAIYPTRQTTVKEKLLKNALLEHGQEEFLTALASYGANSRTFQSCGFHIEIKKFKEEDIFIKSAYEKSKIILTASPAPALLDQSLSAPPLSEKNKPEALSPAATSALPPIDQEKIDEENSKPRQAKIISAEMSLIRRQGFFDKIINSFKKRPGLRTRSMVPFLVAVLAMGGASYAAKKFIFTGENSQSAIFKSVEENVRLAEIQMTKNESASARELLGLSLASLDNMPSPLKGSPPGREANRKVAEVRTRITAIIDRLDQVNARQPELWFDAGTNELVKISVISGSENLLAVDKGNKIFKIAGGSITELGVFPAIEPKFSFASEKYFSVYNGLDQVNVLALDSGKISGHQLKESSPAQDASVYENNLYVLSGNSIYKYIDGAVNGTAQQPWFNGLADQHARALAVDGNVYVLTSQGTVIKYFRGQEESRINLNFRLGENIEFFSDKDGANFYIADYDDRKIRVFDKLTGFLKVTFKFADLPVIKSLAFTGQMGFLVSGDNKIWKINLTP